jgi:hypothetical protein
MPISAKSQRRQAGLRRLRVIECRYGEVILASWIARGDGTNDPLKAPVGFGLRRHRAEDLASCSGLQWLRQAPRITCMDACAAARWSTKCAQRSGLPGGE